MPIKPENKALYPRDWPAIREGILERAGNRCEWCGVENRAVGYRDAQGRFHEDPAGAEVMALEAEPGAVKIVLTVAHLDHDPTNNAKSNLAALCQQCHLRHDAREHAAHAAETRRRQREQAGQLPLPRRSSDEV
jgi:5-methylcytosine-specific restriction endonuclease McrA